MKRIITPLRAIQWKLEFQQSQLLIIDKSSELFLKKSMTLKTFRLLDPTTTYSCNMLQ